jgi:hypothetical protein
MDSPPHNLKTLRNILHETVSEEKVGTYLQDFYLESAACRLRPLSGYFRELALKNVLSCWPDFRPDVQERLTHQVIHHWHALYTRLEREPIADSAAPTTQPPASATLSPHNAVNLIRPVNGPPVRRREFAARSKLPASSGEVPFACSNLPIARSKMPAVQDKVPVTRGDRPGFRGAAPCVTIGTTDERGNELNFLDETPVDAVEQSAVPDDFFKSQDHSDWFDKMLDFVAALMSGFYRVSQSSRRSLLLG